MIRVHLLRGIVGTHDRERVERPFQGETGRQLVNELRRPEWLGLDLTLTCEGKKLRDVDLDEPLEDGREYVLAPTLGWEVAISLAVQFALSWLAQKYLYPRPKPPQLRDDKSSPVYAWDGVSTNYGGGTVVPIIYGRHDVGGQCIHQDVGADQNIEVYETVIAFGEGRCHRLGDLDGGDAGEAENLGSLGPFPEGGPIPQHIRVNGVRLDHTSQIPGATVSFRMGEIDQTPYQSLAQTSIVLLVNQELNGQGTSFVQSIGDTNLIRRLSILLAFPQGLYWVKQTQSGGTDGEFVTFDWEYRLTPGNQPWVLLKKVRVEAPPPGKLTAFVHRETYVFEGLAIPVQGPLEVRLKRTSVAAVGNSVSAVVWRQLSYGLEYQFANPGTATMLLRLLATERLYGDNPNVVCRWDGRRVRVYGLSGELAPGLSAREYWDLPDDPSDPFFGIWSNSPGRNPAWLALDLLTRRYGLERWLRNLQIDYEAFRDLADYADQNLADGRPRYTCDIVLDKPRPAWEWLQAILATARATPYVRGDKISVWYHYQAAHGRGTNVVPARTRTQMFTSANVEKLEVTYLPIHQRPTVLDIEYLDENKEYARDVLPVPDPDSNFNAASYTLNPERFRRQAMALVGVVRKSQVRREGLFRHRSSRLIRTQAELMVGPEALAADLGDVIAVQDWFFQPYDKTSEACRLTNASGTTSSVTLDVPITVVPSDTPTLMVRQQDGSLATRTVLNGPGIVAAGATVSLSSSVTVYKNAIATFGASNKLVKDYQIVGLSLAQDLRRKLQLIEWHPEVHDEPTTLADDELPSGMLPSSDFETTTTDLADNITVRRGLDGKYLIGWETNDPGRTVRIYARRPGVLEAPILLGSAIVPPIVTSGLLPGTAYELIGVVEAKQQVASGALPGDGWTSVTPDEFSGTAPPDVRPVVTIVPEGVLVRWGPVSLPGVIYEIREGAWWFGARVVYRGPAAEFLWRDAPLGALRLMVRAQAPWGIYSQGYAVVPVTNTAPAAAHEITLVALDELATTPSGTLTDLVYDGTAKTLTIAAGKLFGTYVSAEINATQVVSMFWSALASACALEPEDVSGLTFDVNSGEMLWRTIEGRDASPARPGIDLENTPNNVDLEDVPEDLLVTGPFGEVGDRTLATLEVRYDLTGAGAWTAYQPFKLERVVAQKAQFRLTLRREKPELVVTCDRLTRTAFV